MGGDPNYITVSGESAGATNVAHLIVSPLSKDLFNKAIHQSAGWSIAERNMDPDLPVNLSKQLSIELLGDKNNINELKKIDSLKLLNAAEKVYGYTGMREVRKNLKEYIEKARERVYGPSGIIMDKSYLRVS